MKMKRLKSVAPLAFLAGVLVLSPFNSGERGEVWPSSHQDRESVEQGDDLEERVSRVEERIAIRYIDIYFEEGKGKIDSVDDLVKKKGLEKAKKVFYDIEKIPFRVLNEEIDIKEGVSDMVKLYDEIDDRMNWRSRYIIKKFKGEIEYKVGFYRGKIEHEDYELNKEDVSELLEHSENVLDGIKNEVAANNKKYTKFIPFVGKALERLPLYRFPQKFLL
jgi:hypothetical protein